MSLFEQNVLIPFWHGSQRIMFNLTQSIAHLTVFPNPNFNYTCYLFHVTLWMLDPTQNGIIQHNSKSSLLNYTHIQRVISIEEAAKIVQYAPDNAMNMYVKKFTTRSSIESLYFVPYFEFTVKMSRPSSRAQTLFGANV